MIVYHMVLMASIYFHFYNICGFTSSVSCMTSEIVESVMKNNSTYREQKLTPHDVNMTSVMEDPVDLLVFRVVTDSSSGQQSSRMNHRAHYLSPHGNVKQTRGSSSTYSAEEYAKFEASKQSFEDQMRLLEDQS